MPAPWPVLPICTDACPLCQLLFHGGMGKWNHVPHWDFYWRPSGFYILTKASQKDKVYTRKTNVKWKVWIQWPKRNERKMKGEQDKEFLLSLPLRSQEHKPQLDEKYCFPPLSLSQHAFKNQLFFFGIDTWRARIRTPTTSNSKITRQCHQRQIKNKHTNGVTAVESKSQLVTDAPSQKN
jgi:hypothetical protein